MDTHDRRSRALLALVLADSEAVDRLTANYEDTPEYAEAWLTGQGYTPEKATSLAPFLQDALAAMTPRGALREASRNRRGPTRTEL